MIVGNVYEAIEVTRKYPTIGYAGGASSAGRPNGTQMEFLVTIPTESTIDRGLGHEEEFDAGASSNPR
jgi:hypothetical protein